MREESNLYTRGTPHLLSRRVVLRQASECELTAVRVAAVPVRDHRGETEQRKDPAFLILTIIKVF